MSGDSFRRISEDIANMSMHNMSGGSFHRDLLFKLSFPGYCSDWFGSTFCDDVDEPNAVNIACVSRGL